MAEEKNVAAFTPAGTGNYPPYLSINLRNGAFHVTVRAPRTETGDQGETSTIVLSRSEFEAVLKDSLKALSASSNPVCRKCGHQEHKHAHSTIYGMPETHEGGSEYFECRNCGLRTFASDGDYGFTFTFDSRNN